MASKAPLRPVQSFELLDLAGDPKSTAFSGDHRRQASFHSTELANQGALVFALLGNEAGRVVFDDSFLLFFLL